jgi:hypothetical protein
VGLRRVGERLEVELVMKMKDGTARTEKLVLRKQPL